MTREEWRTLAMMVAISVAILFLAVFVALTVGPVFRATGEIGAGVYLLASLAGVYFIYAVIGRLFGKPR